MERRRGEKEGEKEREKERERERERMFSCPKPKNKSQAIRNRHGYITIIDHSAVEQQQQKEENKKRKTKKRNPCSMFLLDRGKTRERERDKKGGNNPRMSL